MHCCGVRRHTYNIFSLYRSIDKDRQRRSDIATFKVSKPYSFQYGAQNEDAPVTVDKQIEEGVRVGSELRMIGNGTLIRQPHHKRCQFLIFDYRVCDSVELLLQSIQ